MIGTIRKHSKWLLWIIAGLTIASFVLFMGTGPARYGNGSNLVNTNLVGGVIYGQKVTPDLYDRMRDDVQLDVLFRYGQWPEDNAETARQIQEQTYIRMMQFIKAKQLGVHVTLQEIEQATANMLHSPALQRIFQARSDEAVPLNSVITQLLQPKGMSEQDLENFVSDDLANEQLHQLYGLSGQLVTPQEATNEYVREFQEYSSEIIFFSASNYLDRVRVSPGEVDDYYTNYMADYRLPDRVQVSYVVFSLSNYLADAQQEIGKSNLEMEVQNIFDKYGMQATPDAKTEGEAKEDIRKVLLRREALQNAVTQADTFAQSVFNMEPVSPHNLAVVAEKEHLTVEHPAPFSASYGPSEFNAPAAFTQAAFQLTPDSPISEPISGEDGVYIIALETNLPSEIPPLARIRGKVTQDLRLRMATAMAQRAGTNFAVQLAVQMAAGKSFGAVGFSAGLSPQVLPPVSLSTQDLPELDDHATLNELKGTLLTTPVGADSGFRDTDDGGFILYVQSRLPIDEEKMAADLPQFMVELREQRAEQAYNDWIQHEANRELRTTPLGREMGIR